MPFMKGPAPIRRTLQYLESGRLFFKERLKIFSLNFNTSDDHHAGARDFAFWYLPQVQYKNPNVQVVTFKNMTPTPFIRCYFDDGKEMLIDIDSQNKEDILNHCIKVLGKSEEVLKAEAKAKQKKHNPAHFGYYCDRHCICEIPGQVPCPGLVKLPDEMRGKFIYKKDL